MNIKEVLAVRNHLEKFLEPYKELIGRSERMHNGRLYISGLLLDGERKSIQPMAERLPGGNEQNLQQFVNQSPWEHEPVMAKLWEEMSSWDENENGVLVLDDTTFPKKGDDSVGVAPQYCGALGKIANCQCIVSWHYAGEKRHWPVKAELFLPKSWRGKKRASKAGVPDDRRKIKTKWELALRIFDEVRKGIPHRAVVFDAWYGESKKALEELDGRKELFVGAIPYNHSFWPADVVVTANENKTGRPRQYPVVADSQIKPIKAQDWGKAAVGWKSIRLKTRKKNVVQAKAFRVLETNHQYWRRPGIVRWLIVEKESSGRMNYYVSNFPETASLEEMIFTVHERWKVEQGYQRLKEELGVDHFEGRSWRGLHHHITMCFLAYAFLLRTGYRLKKKVLPSRNSADGSTAFFPQAGAHDAETGWGGSAGSFSAVQYAMAGGIT